MAQVYYDNDTGEYFYYNDDGSYYDDLVEESDEGSNDVEYDENNTLENDIKPVPNAKLKQGKRTNTDRRKYDSGIDNGKSADDSIQRSVRAVKSINTKNEYRKRKEKEEVESESESSSESTSSSSGYSSSESSSESSSSD